MSHGATKQTFAAWPNSSGGAESADRPHMSRRIKPYSMLLVRMSLGFATGARRSRARRIWSFAPAMRLANSLMAGMEIGETCLEIAPVSQFEVSASLVCLDTGNKSGFVRSSVHGVADRHGLAVSHRSRAPDIQRSMSTSRLSKSLGPSWADCLVIARPELASIGLFPILETTRTQRRCSQALRLRRSTSLHRRPKRR